MSFLKNNGYEYYDLKEQLQYTQLEEDLEELKQEFTTLPIDSYAKELNRYRRYARAVIIPGTGEVQWLPSVETEEGEMYKYFQGSFNPEYTNAARDFPAISEKIRANKLLNDIVMFDYRQTFWREEDMLLPVHAGIHFVKLEVEDEGDMAVSSPNHLHQDGEPFTFAHLVHRQNVEGGLNAIGVPEVAGDVPEDVDDSKLLKQMTLTEPLESYGVFDPMVSHYVAPVTKGKKEKKGQRSMILIDFQPTVCPDPDEISAQLKKSNLVFAK
ncbi:2OG-Fe dioxygenase family protein [Salimicrobium sp. PL1-032A]|uniref:2OG-Fe dioxygenase family protein n=1 Tax=Salimicrobium sp. PL1-032A TaxID=3095364 RepID=UPI003260FE94